MKKYCAYSKRLHLATLCCFLLPFFYTGCGPSAEEKAASEKEKQDSIEVVTAKTGRIIKDSIIKTVDTVIQKTILSNDTINKQTAVPKQHTTELKTEKESKTPSQEISKQFPFLKPLLTPKEDTYTGLATVIDSIPFISFFAIFISFLFLIISLVIKFIESNSRKTIALLNTIAFIFLLVSQPYSFNSERLWGITVSIICLFALTLYDFYLIKISRHIPNDSI